MRWRTDAHHELAQNVESQSTMLRQTKDLLDSPFVATNGAIVDVKDFYFPGTAAGDT
ncbi:MAG: hypothetical protein GZ093_16900 [Rhodoferax sp.]|uniref:hypothetical protein n=1 Tax=Rhodoferax sp. TaxID=50421 RepID=UPI0013FFB31F|nr:hypothetical protein [Rhodoferax sp.]NDP40394.1 hypothetical protein [Rhodoferax sp.]